MGMSVVLENKTEKAELLRKEGVFKIVSNRFAISIQKFVRKFLLLRYTCTGAVWMK